MQRITVVTALVTAVVFAAAGWVVGSKFGKVTILLKHSHEEKNCKGVDCKVDIKIDCVDPSHPSAATCEAYSDKAEVIRFDDKNKAIDFEIKTSGFDFNQTDGIKFTTFNDGDKYFTPCTPGGSTKKYTCAINGAKQYILYKYSIHIETLDPTDPWVVNY
jgi:hypothetical protein